MARWLVSDGTNAQEGQADAVKTAVGGVVKPILRACAAENGIVRQFWPPTVVTTDPAISWDTTALTVTESVVDPLDSVSSIVFSRSLGTYSYKNYPQANGAGIYLNPPVTGAGQYLIRVDQTSGTALTGTLATWIDIFSLAEHTWSLDEAVVGALAALANISISQDNGFGGPVSGTTVVKAVTFASEVRAGSKVVWSTEPYDLVEIREGQDADCILTFTPDGWATGDAFTSGSFTENWHKDAPDLSNTPIYDRDGNLIIDRGAEQINLSFNSADFTVNATLVSGTAPTGSALATNLTLDEVRQWTLLAITGENLSCALDVTVSDGIAPVTKRITMNSQRTAASATPVWTIDEWTLSDVAFPQPNSLFVEYTMTFAIAGTATGRCDNNSGGGIQETDTWLPGGETAADYEVKISGGIVLTTGTLDVWYNLGTEVVFVAETATSTIQRESNCTLSVRKIGDLAVIKPVTLVAAEDNGEIAP